MANAEVISVLPNKIKIRVKNLKDFKLAEEKFSVGSYVSVSDSDDCAIIAIIENFIIEQENDNDERNHILEATPIGFLDSEGNFIRGGNNIAIPPTGVKPASKNEIQNIYNQISEQKRFTFSKLVQNNEIRVPVDGDRFFNKHIAIAGSTGSGKSHTVAKIIQEAKNAKESSYNGLNNSHIVIFDIHSEYKQAFPEANHLDTSNLYLPYWLMNGDELEELFIETGENQAYNQSSLLRRIITRNKQIKNENIEVVFDTPVKFSIQEVLNCIVNLSNETRDYKNPSRVMIEDMPKEFSSDEEKYDFYFQQELSFSEVVRSKINKGTYNDGSLEKFIYRIKNKISDKRLNFMFGEKATIMNINEILIELLGYKKKNESNITIIDLSGVPFEILSITVSLISRMLFEYGYYLKRIDRDKCETPLLLVYEEAHKYIPKIQDAKYNSSRLAIERIAKEGRKYGVTLMIVSQRPSEISETIFSQCNNFVVMRLTNPQDQNYVKKLLPDSLGPVIDSLPILRCGQAIIIGDSIIMPSLVSIERCNPEPSSNDIEYLQEWKKPWVNIDFESIIKESIK